jgi:two-component system sensor histidine kinase VicK
VRARHEPPGTSALEERVLERTDEVERQRAHLETIVEQLPVGVVIVEASSESIDTMNDEAKRILESVGGSIDQLPLERTLIEGAVVTEERIEFRHPQQGLLTLEFSAAPVRDRSGGIVSAVAVIQDITMRERNEQAEREFITNAAHELQGPVAAIASAAEVLQAGAKDTADRDLFLEHIDREALRLARITRALLTLARTQTNIEEPSAELIVIGPLLELIADRMEPAQGVELNVDCPGDLAVLSNRELIEQAVSNVISNSVKHTKEGSILVTGVEKEGFVEIGVADTGGGIPEEVLPRVFDRFYRGDVRDEGFGLGLAIVRASVEAVQGELVIDSKVGVGTTVTIRVPSAATMVNQ